MGTTILVSGMMPPGPPPMGGSIVLPKHIFIWHLQTSTFQTSGSRHWTCQLHKKVRHTKKPLFKAHQRVYLSSLWLPLFLEPALPTWTWESASCHPWIFRWICEFRGYGDSLFLPGFVTGQERWFVLFSPGHQLGMFEMEETPFGILLAKCKNVHFSQIGLRIGSPRWSRVKVRFT